MTLAQIGDYNRKDVSGFEEMSCETCRDSGGPTQRDSRGMVRDGWDGDVSSRFSGSVCVLVAERGKFGLCFWVVAGDI